MNASQSQRCTHLKLRQLTRVVTRHYDRHVQGTGLKTGLKNTQYALLSNVIRLGPVRAGELAKRMHMDASTLTRNMQPLVAHGWLRIDAGSNARSHLVDVTETGRTQQAEAQRAWKAAQLAVVVRLGIERVRALHELLDACIECLDSAHEGAAQSAAASVDGAAVGKRAQHPT